VTIRSVSAGALTAFATLAALATPPAHAQMPEVEWRGALTADIRLFADEGLAFERSRTSAQLRMSARLNRNIAAVGDLRVVFTEESNPRDIEGLRDITAISPYWLESDALFVDFFDLGLDGLDLRVGRQQIIWGTADRFHAVSYLNPLDVEDPILFGRVLANEMVTLSYRPDWSVGGSDDGETLPWLDEVALELVFVPFFKPARLPRSAALAFTDRDVFRARANTPVTQDLLVKQDVLEDQAGWRFGYEPRVVMPARDLTNSMFGARLRGRLFDIDTGISYFRGFFPFPRAEMISADTSRAPEVGVDLTLTYPRMQVLGFDMATSLGFLDGLGLWGELGVHFHDALYRVISTGPAIGVDAVEVEHRAGSFVKAVVGVDYTPVDWLYLNFQYLHGFVDEFGRAELGNYLVSGGDVKLGHDSVQLRFFNIFNLDDGSYVLYPQLAVRPWVGGELILGAFIYSSSFNGFNEDRKFESRATGKSSVFLQARATL